jgi:hypothetical protein
MSMSMTAGDRGEARKASSSASMIAPRLRIPVRGSVAARVASLSRARCNAPLVMCSRVSTSSDRTASTATGIAISVSANRGGSWLTITTQVIGPSTEHDTIRATRKRVSGTGSIACARG